MKLLELAADTDLGKQRKDNQDNFICLALWSDDQGLIGVIDGVGGYEGGEVAAAIAKETIEFYMSAPKGDALSMLKEAVVLANNQILESKEKDQKLEQMCCVLTVAVADAKNQSLYYAHVGDTRLYRFRNGILEKITRDHSLVGVREDAGVLTEEEAMQHPRRNVILRQVGTELHRIDDPEFLESGETDFLPGDALLICSDGLSDMITRDQMIAVFNEQADYPTAAGKLIALANEAGGQDNITVVLARNLSMEKPLEKAPSNPQTETILPASAVEINTGKPARKSGSRSMLAVFVSAFLLVMAFWLFNRSARPDEMPVVAENIGVRPLALVDSGISKSPNNTSQAVSRVSPIDSLTGVIHDQGGKELSLEKLGVDTIVLSRPVELGKILSLTGGKNNSIVLIPDSLSKIKTAIAITGAEKNKIRKDTILLKNLVINGFETGIQVEGHVVVRLENVLFKDTRHTVSYKVIDSLKSGYLSF